MEPSDRYEMLELYGRHTFCLPENTTLQRSERLWAPVTRRKPAVQNFLALFQGQMLNGIAQRGARNCRVVGFEEPQQRRA